MDYSAYTAKWISKRSSANHLAHDSLEKPAMTNLLPVDLTGKTILCVGCADGSECQMLLDKGAKRVIGIDKNPGFIEYAKNTYPEYEFFTMSAEDLTFGDDQFDFVYSSLTLHYLPDWPDFFRKLQVVSKPQTEFLFSAHHPVKWGAQATRTKQYNQFLMGYKKYKDQAGGQNYELFGDYLNFRPIQEKLFGELEITHYHRSLSQMFQEITQNGFEVLEIVEPKPIIESKAKKLDFYEVYSKVPLFIIFRLRNTKKQVVV